MTEIKINEDLKNKYPVLIDLIKNTPIMDDDERQYWIDIIPKLSDIHLIKLTEILQNEKEKLEELEIKYQEELKNLN